MATPASSAIGFSPRRQCGRKSGSQRRARFRCLNDSRRVMVQRDIDGHSWSMPAWLMRLVFKETKRKRAA